MKFFIYLSFIVCFLYGFAHTAMAQRIYITKEPAGHDQKTGAFEDSAPRQIFLRPKTNSNKHFKPSSNAVSYGEKLELAQAKQYTAQAAKIYEQWQAEGFKPQTMEERLAYSKVRRTVKFAPMLERQERLIEYLEKR